MSPLLFKAVLEQAIRRWKQKVVGCGLDVGGAERLTHVRYADDLILYAGNLSDLVKMVDLLAAELQNYGLI